jgi:hypothetical protein
MGACVLQAGFNRTNVELLLDKLEDRVRWSANLLPVFNRTNPELGGGVRSH